MSQTPDFHLVDLTNCETVYSTRIKTIQIALDIPDAGAELPPLLTLTRAIDAKQVLDAIYRHLDDDQEHFVILILNTACELVGYKVIASGGLDRVYVDPKLVFRSALLLGASNIILTHNHPNGSTTPSPQDIALTGSLVLGGRLLYLNVLDHIIYTKKQQRSLRDELPELFGAPDEQVPDPRVVVPEPVLVLPEPEAIRPQPQETKRKPKPTPKASKPSTSTKPKAKPKAKSKPENKPAKGRQGSKAKAQSKAAPAKR